MQQYISSNASLKGLSVYGSKHVELLLPIVFRPSSLESIHLGADKPLIDNHTIINLRNMNNSNLKELQVSLVLKLPTSTLCDNTSLKYLANHICIFFDLAWYLTKQKITFQLTYISQYFVNGMKKTHNSTMEVYLYEQCAYMNTTQQLLLHIPKQYRNYTRIYVC